MFIMIRNILNDENTVTWSIYTKSSYDDWWMHHDFGHDVTSIRLGYPPVYKWTPHYGLPHHLKSIIEARKITFSGDLDAYKSNVFRNTDLSESEGASFSLWDPALSFKIRAWIPSILDNKTSCNWRCISNSILGVVGL